MKQLKYNVYREHGEPVSVTVFIKGEPHVMTSSHANFLPLLKELKRRRHNERKIRNLMDVGGAIQRGFDAVKKFVTGNDDSILAANVRVVNGHVLYDGVPVDAALSNAIIRFHNEGHDDYRPLVRFLKKVYANPNVHSREHLYRWLMKYEFSITTDGDFIAYKGVSRNSRGHFVSISSGSDEVMVNGRAYMGNIPNPIKGVVKMDRDKVTFNPRQGCARGLHAGSWHYASSWSKDVTDVLAVKINPADVVSVPTDADDQKLRVCQYKVLERVDAPSQKAYRKIGAVSA